MRSPEGQEFPNLGIYLVVEPNRRLVTTDAFVDAWTPSEKAFMVAEMTFEPEGAGTRYTATARHWTAEDTKAHVDMGFHEGWGMVADQMAELAKTLKA